MPKDIDIEFGTNKIKIDLDPWEWVVIGIVTVSILLWCDVSGVW